MKKILFIFLLPLLLGCTNRASVNTLSYEQQLHSNAEQIREWQVFLQETRSAILNNIIDAENFAAQYGLEENEVLHGFLEQTWSISANMGRDISKAEELISLYETRLVAGDYPNKNYLTYIETLAQDTSDFLDTLNLWEQKITDYNNSQQVYAFAALAYTFGYKLDGMEH